MTWTVVGTLAPPLVPQGVFDAARESYNAGDVVTSRGQAYVCIAALAHPETTDLYAALVQADSPSFYWKLAQTTGTALTDASSHGRSGTLLGSVTYGAGGIVGAGADTALTFDGSSAWAYQATSDDNPTTYSEECWLKTTTTVGGVLIGFGDATTFRPSNRDRFLWMSDEGTLHFGVFDAGTHIIASTVPCNDGQWHHIVATQGPTGMHLYVDGLEVDSNTGVTTSQDYVGYWRVGGADNSGWGAAVPSSFYFGGTLDEVAIWTDTQVSASTVAAHHAAGSGTAHFLAPGDDPDHWAPLASAAPGTPTLYGPYTVDYSDIPHDGDTLTLWTPQVGDVLLSFWVDQSDYSDWDQGTLFIGQTAAAAPFYFGTILYGNTVAHDMTYTNGQYGRPFGSADPVQIMLHNPSPNADPLSGNISLYALVARAVAP